MKILIGFLIITEYAFAQNFKVTVDTTNPIRQVPDEFLSVTIDSFTVYTATWEYLNFTFMEPLAKGLAPAYMRLGGTYSDLIFFNETAKDGEQKQNLSWCLQEGKNAIYFCYFVINKKQFLLILKIQTRLYTLEKTISKMNISIKRQMKVKSVSAILTYPVPAGDFGWKPGCTIFTADQMKTLCTFCKNAGWKYIFDLNLMLRNGTGYTEANITESRWNSTNAKALIDYASSIGCGLNFELGNEPDGGFNGMFHMNLTGAQIAQDYMDLKSLVDSGPYGNGNSITVGPATIFVYRVTKANYFLAAGGGNTVKALTAHSYYFDGKGTNLSMFLDPHYFDFYPRWVKQFINDTHNYSPLWMGEGSNGASGGGTPNMSDRYVGGFMWLDKLGMSGVLGVEVNLRQAFVGAGGPYPFGNYTLLNSQMLPNTDYWLSFFYKKIVGNTVYNLTVDQPNERLRIYSGSTRNNAEFVVYGVWLGNTSITIDIPQLTNKNVTLYLFKEAEPGNLQSNLSRLNGQLIEWNTHVPMAIQGGTPVQLPVSFPEFSMFWIVSRETSPYCPFGWYKESSVPNKCLKIVSSLTQPFFSANFDCQTYGITATILSVDNAFENAEIAQYLKSGNNSCTQAYLGLYKNENNWIWSNGDVSSYRNWNGGNPSNDNTKNCVTIDQSSGQWSNTDCDLSQCYICQIFA